MSHRNPACAETASAQQPLCVVLTPEEANAIVYVIAFQIVSEAEYLESLPVSSRPFDLLSIAARAARISRFAAINDQLAWWARRGAGGERLVITAMEAVLLELATILEATAEDRVRFPDGALEPFAFEQAALAINASLVRADE